MSRMSFSVADWQNINTTTWLPLWRKCLGWNYNIGSMLEGLLHPFLKKLKKCVKCDKIYRKFVLIALSLHLFFEKTAIFATWNNIAYEFWKYSEQGKEWGSVGIYC